MRPLGWIFLGVVLAPALGLAAFYVRVLRDSENTLSANVRLFIIVRTTELLLFALIFVAAVVTSRWVFIAEVVPLVVLPLVRGHLKRRELRTGA